MLPAKCIPRVAMLKTAVVLATVLSTVHQACSTEVNREAFPVEDAIRCAQERGQALGTCTANAVRRGDGTTRVTVTFPNGFSRILLFEGGAFVRANPTMSGVGTDTDWSVEDGRHVIRVDDQRFELPVGLVTGGSTGTE